MELTYGSCCSGIGGELGLEQAGMTAKWQVEKDKHCLQVLERHWSDVTKFDDLNTVGRHNLEPVDLICGGTPCQDLSVAGKRAGLAGSESRLFFEFVRVLSELTPRWVLFENVPGLLSSNGGRDMGAVLGAFSQLGYGWAYRVLDAQYFGVPQRRRRVFIVGCLGDAGRAAQVLFESESVYGDSPPIRGTGEGSTTAFTTSPDGSGKEDYLTPVIDARAKDSPRRNQGGTIILHENKSGQTSHSYQSVVSFAQNTRDEVREIGGNIAGALAAQSGMKQQTYLSIRAANTGANGWGIQDDVSHTLDSSTPHAGQREASVRRLTPLECERLQGFPDGWTEGHADSIRYRMLGNAWAVPPVRWVGERIMEYEREPLDV